MLQDEAPALSVDRPDDSLEADERRIPVAVVRHEPFDASLALDRLGERHRDRGARDLGPVFVLEDLLLVPVCDLERRFRMRCHCDLLPARIDRNRRSGQPVTTNGVALPLDEKNVHLPALSVTRTVRFPVKAAPASVVGFACAFSIISPCERDESCTTIA